MMKKSDWTQIYVYILSRGETKATQAAPALSATSFTSPFISMILTLGEVGFYTRTKYLWEVGLR